jgi:aryl-alcohol dehydrogenase-like predicted oxidoreductase
MEYRNLGHSGLKVPVLSFGTGTFGGEGPLFSAWGRSGVEEARKLIDVCLEFGVNLFDTADVYSNGASEEILGAAIKGRRDQVLISTKTSLPMGEPARRCRLVAPPIAARCRRLTQAAPHRLYRPSPAACLRRVHADRRSPLHA